MAAEYEVGYRKPPKATRFKPGVSGNPKGRAKGAKNLATLVEAAINERVTITENGRRRSVTKLEVAVKQLVNTAASGDIKSLRQLLELVGGVEARRDLQAKPVVPLDAADLEVLDGIATRLNRMDQGAEDV